MNKVITINLGGIAFQLEDAGYEALRAYLDTAAARLQGNPDREEILSDIERAIGDKFRAQLGTYKNVVLASEVRAVLEQMGPIEDEASGAAEGAAPTGAAPSSGAAAPEAEAAAGQPKRLYRILEGRMLAGVCNGVAAYFNVDPTIVRLAFIALTLAWGTGVLVYLIMAFVVPVARTPEEKSAARGSPETAQQFIRRAKQGYYEATRSFSDREQRRAWKRKFKQEMRDWRASFHREMASRGPEWRAHWQRAWATNPGAGVALPVVSLLHGALVVAWLCTVITLLSAGTILGLALPAGVPVWAALFVLLLAYGLLVWPLKAARRAFYYGACSGMDGAWLFLFVDVVIWVALVGWLLWLGLHHAPELRTAIHNIPVVFRDAADSIRDWWHSH